MKIDLRIPIIVVAFYTPGFLLLGGAWMLGYSTEEARDVVAVLGIMLGIVVSVGAIAFVSSEVGPIWWTIPGTKGDSE